MFGLPYWIRHFVFLYFIFAICNQRTENTVDLEF